MASNRPPRTVHPSQKLNQDNIGELEVASHRNFVEAAKGDPKQPSLSELSNAAPSTQAPTESSEPESITEAEPACSNPRKRRVPLSPVQSDHETASPNDHNNSDNDESESQGATEPQRKPTKPKKKKKKTAHSKSTCYPLPYL